MIYTVGYQRMSGPEVLVKLAEELGVDTVLDCRSVPRSRKRGFGGDRLAAVFKSVRGIRFVAAGADLGGRPGPTQRGLNRLEQTVQDEGRVVLLLCAEAAPGDCHRHHTIGLPLAKKGIKVRHVFENELIEPVELQRSIDRNCEYEFEPLREVETPKLLW